MSCLQSWHSACARIVDHKTSARVERERRVLVVGLPGSGKSTLIKQLRAAQSSRFPFSETEIASFKTMIYTNIIYSAKALIQGAALQLDDATQWDIIVNYTVPQSLDFIPTEVGDAIRRVLLIPAVDTMIAMNQCGLPDTAIYFLRHSARICHPQYQVLTSDILRIRNHINGLSETRVRIDSYPPAQLTLYEYGPILTDSYKWIDQFERAIAFVFCVGLDSYDNQGYVTRAIELFRRIVNLKFPSGVSIAFILVFTKLDIMEKKLREIPLDRVFADYKGGRQVKSAVLYLATKFKDQCIQADQNRIYRFHFWYGNALIEADTFANQILMWIKDLVVSREIESF